MMPIRYVVPRYGGGAFALNFSFAVFCIILLSSSASCASYLVSDKVGVGRTFDGIGGISGGGATSKLLVNYPEKQRNEILDILFKPNFGASLQIFKVEIGGDGESTDGTESSHMHEEWDENYHRGYEWWMMKEAKKRNPDIKLYGLSWSFPGWLGSTKDKTTPYSDPHRLASYILKWVQGAHKVHNLTIDYLGIWNERQYDATYVRTLRSALDQAGYSHIQIVASDSGWEIATDMLTDNALYQAVDIIGTHYQGTNTTIDALLTEKPLWSSEDYSTYNNDIGTGCWARLLNQNYAHGFMTSTISWNVLASYYEALPFGRDGLMTAVEPWSGHYDITNTIWATAHTTQFTSVGWRYLQHGSGTGFLQQGGSYVSLTCSCHKQLTIVIETMTHNHSICIRPELQPYTVRKQNATFNLAGAMSNITTLNVWYTKLRFDGKPSTVFKKLPAVKVKNGEFTIELDVDVLYTLTTINRGFKYQPKDIPHTQPFPLPYKDNFTAYAPYSEAYNFVPQAGVWEVRATTDKQHVQVNRQVLIQTPVKWCKSSDSPINIGGDYQWSNVSIALDVFVPSVNGTSGVYVGARVDRGGCDVGNTHGVFCMISAKTQSFIVTTDLYGTEIITGGKVAVKTDKWYPLSLAVKGDKGSCKFNGNEIAKFPIKKVNVESHGFVAYGTAEYKLADFDNLYIKNVTKPI